MPDVWDGLVFSRLSSNASGPAPHDDDSLPLAVAQHGVSSLQRYESSGMLAELKIGINTLSIATRHMPESHPIRPACLSHLGHGLKMRFERLDDVVRSP